MKIVARVILSVISAIVCGWLGFGLNLGSTVVVGRLAGMQFDNSDASFYESMAGMRFFSGVEGIFSLAFMFIMIAIWWKPFKSLLAALVTVFVLMGTLSNPAMAYYQKVAGPIDVAVISRSDGFVWVKRKHYFPSDLNPRFFVRKFGLQKLPVGGSHASP